MTQTGSPKHIGVISGGIAGLTTAYRLALAGHRVSLWERDHDVGGLARAFPVAGTHLELFYHHLFQSDRDIAALMDELGIGDKLIWLPSNVGYFADGKIWPLNGAVDLLKLGFLPIHDRIRLGLVTAYLQRVTKWRRFEQVTAHTWLRRALGSRAYDRTFGSQLRAKFGSYYEQIAMVWFWNKIYLRTTSRRSPLDQEKLGYIEGSFNTLIDHLAAASIQLGATLRTGVSPTTLTRRDDDTWDVQLDRDEPPVNVDAVVATTPSSIFARLVPELPESFRAQLNTLDYEAAVVAILQLDRPLSGIYWLNVADPDLTFTAVIEQTNFIDPKVYGGKRFVYLSKYLEVDHPYFSLSDSDLLERYIPDLKKINPNFDATWIERSWVFRARSAQPLVTLNYSEKIPPHRTPLPNLYLANMSQIYPEDRGTNYAVRLGNEVSNLVLNDIAASVPWRG